MPSVLSLQVNGRPVRLSVDDPAMPLLYALRDELGLHGPRFGCGLGQCGACTVLVEGTAQRSCVTELHEVQGKAVTTLEGLGPPGKLHPLQQAFLDEQAGQCGYCLNGMILQAKTLLDRDPNPGEAEIREALAKNLCRCGTHLRIVRAIQRVVAAGQKEAPRAR